MRLRAAMMVAPLALAGCNPAGERVQPVAEAETDAPAASQPNAPESAAPRAPVGSGEAAANAVTPPFAEVPNAHPNAPIPAPIPAKFRGTFAASKAACADLADPSRLTISGRTVRHPDFVIFGDSVAVPNPNAFSLKGKIETTGAPADAHYSIDAAGAVLTDQAGGGAIRVRCA